jgi:hypothetical protein
MDVEEELKETKQTIKKMEDEMEKMREEMAQMRDTTQQSKPMPYALGFRPNEYLAMNFVKSSEWVSKVLVGRMNAVMKKYPKFFHSYMILGNVDSVGARTCAWFNRGEICREKWHVNSKPIRSDQDSQTGPTRFRRELRIHCCVLCKEALGIIAGHTLLTCPWIKSDTWKMVFESGEAADMDTGEHNMT